MPQLKRLILWKGDPNQLPNRLQKDNVLLQNPTNLGSDRILNFENPDNPSLPYEIPLLFYSSHLVLFTRNTLITGKNIYILQDVGTRFDGSNPKYPALGGWGETDEFVVTPGVYIVHNNNDKDIKVKATPLDITVDPREDTHVWLYSGISISPLTKHLIFERINYHRFRWKEDLSIGLNVRGLGSIIKIPVIFARHKKEGYFFILPFSIENLKKVLTRNIDALVIWCDPQYKDNTFVNYMNTFKVKTWEELGLKELYDEYMNSKPKK